MTSIAALNDLFRRQILSNPDLWPTNKRIPGKAVTTPGVARLPADGLRTSCEQVRDFSAFAPANDPHGEHDFGAIQVGGEQFFWKIDYLDPVYEFGADDPPDLTGTRRVLTIMMAEEW